MAEKRRREDNIRLIIELEDRIAQCKRCKTLLSCVRKPALGKGDLQPEIVLVFQNDIEQPDNKELIKKIREIVKKEFGTNKIYHTFMVRCQPKACSIRTNTSSYMENNKLIDRDFQCLLTNRICEGVGINPADENVISCLPFLVEELGIFEPGIIIMFGERVTEFVLKSYGVFQPVSVGEIIHDSNNNVFIAVSDPRHFSAEQLKRVKELKDAQ